MTHSLSRRLYTSLKLNRKVN
ncbi:hypothetical protein AKJ16_DCAP26327 [Drosera capensis]